MKHQKVHSSPVNIRAFSDADVPALLTLMKELAAFEDYLDQFVVTEQDLRTRGLRSDPDFTAFVAEADGELVGYAVCYQVGFTFTLKPTVVLKELYVSETARGSGVGKQLFEAIKYHAQNIGAGEIQWLVLPDNGRAKTFYRQHDGKLDTDWERWHLPLC